MMKYMTVPIFTKLLDSDEDHIRSSTSSSNYDDDAEEDIAHEAWSADKVSLSSQSELKDLIWELNVEKQSAEMLASRLQEKHLKAGTSVSFYGNREEKLIMYFHSDGQLVYCTDVDGFLLAMGLSAYCSND